MIALFERVLICGFVMMAGCGLASAPDNNIQTLNNSGPTDAEAASIPETYTSISPFADSLLIRAHEHIEEAKYDSAVVVSEKARDAYEGIENREGMIRSDNAKGDAMERAGQYDEALNHMEATLQQGVSWLGSNHAAIADTYNKIGIINRKKGNYSLALESYEKAVGIRIKAYGRLNKLVGRSLNNIGVVYAELGDYTTAYDYYAEALSIRMNTLGEENVDVAQSYNNIGVALKNTGDYEQSILYHERALAIRKEVLGEAHPSVGASFYNMGVTLSEKGEYSQALQNHEKSLSVWQKAFPQGHPLIAFNYNALSSDHQRLGNFSAALEYEQESLDLQKEIFGTSHPNVGHGYLNIGDIFMEKGQFEKALTYYNLCKENWELSLGGSHPSFAKVHQSIGEVYLKLNEPEEALLHAGRAIEANRILGDTFDSAEEINIEDFSSETELLNTLELRAQAFYALSDGVLHDQLEASLDTYMLAANVMDQHRRSFRSEGSKLILASRAATIFEEAIGAALQLYRLTGRNEYLNIAFQFAERGKASVLIDAMHESDARQFAGIPDSLLQEEKNLRTLLDYFDRSIKSEEVKNLNADQEKIARWKEELFTLKKKYDVLLETFEEVYPEYFDLRYSSYTATIDDIRDFMLGADDILIEYVVGEDSLYIFAVSETENEVATVPIDSTLYDSIEQLREGIIGRSITFYAPSAYQLYTALIKPVEDLATSKSNWIIVPDGPLNSIPFEALLDNEVVTGEDYAQFPFIIKDHTVRYTYSSTLELGQLALQEMRNGRYSEPASRKDFIAFAPVFLEGVMLNTRADKVLSGFRPDTLQNGQWGYLPHSRLEVETIESLFKERYGIWDQWFGKRATIYLNKEASEHTLKSADLRSHRYVHFATHSIANEDVPELSGIVLSQDTTGGEDGVLHLGEVYNLDLDAELVVLSGCQTGLGMFAKGEGLVGLTRGFMYAGADALLASLWQVGDGSTRAFMESFYEEKLGGVSAVQALQRAKLAMIKSHPELAMPFYWAGFILVGNPRSNFQNKALALNTISS